MALKDLIFRIKSRFDGQGTDAAQQGLDQVTDSVRQNASALIQQAQAANKAEQEFEDLARDLGTTSSELRDIQRQSGASVSDLKQIARAAEDLGAEADQATSSLANMETPFGNLAQTAKLFVTGRLLGFLKSSTEETAVWAQEQIMLADAFQISYTRSENLGKQFRSMGGDISDLRGLFAGLSRGIGEANMGEERMIETFRELGLETAYLKSADPADALLRILKAAEKMSSSDAFANIAPILGEDDTAKVLAQANRIIDILEEDIPEGIEKGSRKNAQELSNGLRVWNTFIEDIKTGAGAFGQAVIENIAHAFGFKEGQGGGIFKSFVDTFISTTETNGFIAEGSARMLEQLTGLTENVKEIYREAAELSSGVWERAYGNIGTSGDAMVSISILQSGKTRDEWLKAIKQIEKGHDELRQRAIESFGQMASAAESEAERAMRAWARARSNITSQIGNPAERATMGDLGLADTNEEGASGEAYRKALPQIKASQLERDIAEINNPPGSASEDTGVNWPSGVV